MVGKAERGPAAIECDPQARLRVPDRRRRRGLPRVEGDPQGAGCRVRRSRHGGDLRVRSRGHAGHCRGRFARGIGARHGAAGVGKENQGPRHPCPRCLNGATALANFCIAPQVHVSAETFFAQTASCINHPTVSSRSSASPVQRVTAVEVVMRMAADSCAATSPVQAAGIGAGLSNASPLGSNEPARPVIERMNDDLPFVHQPVVEPAERDQVREFRLAAVGPVLHVVTVDVTLEGTAREATPLVPRLQGPTDPRRNGASPAAYIQRLTLRVLDDPHDTGIAGEASRGLGGDRRAVLQLATTGVSMLQRFRIHVHHDLLAV